MIISAYLIDLYADWNFGEADDKLGATATIVLALHSFASISITIRRLHDIDRRGWWMVLYYFPVLGIILLVINGITPSTPGSNRFGPPVPVRQRRGGKPNQSDVIARPASSGVDLEKLEKLASLRATGAIDDQEFQSLKAGIIGGGA